MNKDLSIIVIGRICQILIMLASIRLLTTLLSEDQVGNYYLIMALVAFFNLVFFNPPGMYFSRHLLSWKENNNIFNVLFVFVILIVLLSMILGGITYATFYLLEYESRFPVGLFLSLLLLTFLISTVHRNTLAGINILGYRKKFVFFTLLTLITGLLLSILFINFYNQSAIAWLFGVVLSEFLIVGFIFKIIIKGNSFSYKKIKNKLELKYIKKIMIYAVPIAATTFLMWGQNFSYRFFVEYKYSIEALSFLAVGMTVSSSIFGAVESISIQYFNPIFLKNISKANKLQRAESWSNMANKLIPIYILCAIYVLAMAPYLVNVLVSDKFRSVYIYTMIGAVFEFFRVSSNILSFVGQSELNTKSTVKPYMLGFVFTVAFLFFSDFSEMLYMVPAIMASSYLLVCLYLYLEMKKLLDIRLRINLISLTVFSLPLFLPFSLSLNSEEIFHSLIVLGGGGGYFLLIIWLLIFRNNNLLKSALK